MPCWNSSTAAVRPPANTPSPKPNTPKNKQTTLREERPSNISQKPFEPSYGKASQAVGCTGKVARPPEEQADALLELFGRRRQTYRKDSEPQTKHPQKQTGRPARVAPHRTLAKKPFETTYGKAS
jgi:hypothetical protein